MAEALQAERQDGEQSSAGLEVGHLQMQSTATVIWGL